MENSIEYMLSIRSENLHPKEFERRAAVFVGLMCKTCELELFDECLGANEFNARVRMSRKPSERDLQIFCDYSMVKEVFCETIQ